MKLKKSSFLVKIAFFKPDYWQDSLEGKFIPLEVGICSFVWRVPISILNIVSHIAIQIFLMLVLIVLVCAIFGIVGYVLWTGGQKASLQVWETVDYTGLILIAAIAAAGAIIFALYRLPKTNAYKIVKEYLSAKKEGICPKIQIVD